MSLTADTILLANAPLFGSLAQDELRLIAFGARKRPFRAGDVLFHEGRAADGAAVVEAGRIRLENAAGDHRIAERFALLDEFALVGRRPHVHTMTAETDGSLMLIDRTLFRRMLEEFPDIAKKTRDRLAARLERLAVEAEGALRRLERAGV